MASPLLSLPNAVEAEGFDGGVAWHYGDPFAEQHALAAGRAWVDQSNRGVVTITGPDRLGWLHSLTTQHLSELAPGVSTETLVLSPRGRIEEALHLVDDGETTWITTEPGAAARLVAWLQTMRFMLRVEPADVSDRWAVVGGPSALLAGSSCVAGDVPPVWHDPWPRVGPGSTSYAVVPDDEHPGFDRTWVETLVPRADLAALLAAVPLAGTWAAEALRVVAWRPRAGADTDHRTIPHELDWLRTAVHLQKGCYRGQETVARVHNLGRPPRRLVLLHLDGSEHVLPAHGAAVRLDGRVVGAVTSPVRDLDLGPTALAVVKRSTSAAATLLVEVEDGAVILAAAQEIIVAP
jgi:hypothetical protein